MVKFKEKELLLLLLLYLFHMANICIWLKMDTTPLVWDPNRHLLYSLELFDTLRTAPLQLVKAVIENSGRYSFLVPLAVSPFFAIFGQSSDAGVFINSAIFLPVLLYGVYALGKLLFNRKVGIFAAFIVSMYPIILDQLKTFQPDLPLAAILTLAFYFLFKSEYFTDRKYSLLFGVCLGLAALTKINFLGFIIMPLLYIFWIIIADKKPKYAKRHILAAMAVAAAASFIYYYYHFAWVMKIIKPDISFEPYAAALLEKSHFFIKFLTSLSWYIWGLIGYQLSFFFFSIFIIGILLLYKTAKIKRDVYVILALWIIAPLLLLCYFRPLYCDHCSSFRYSLPILPAIALITSAGVLKIGNKIIKQSLIAIIMFFAFVQFLALSYGMPQLPSQIKIPIIVPDAIKRPYLPDHIILFMQCIPAERPIGNFYHPAKTGWYEKADEILEIINKDTKGSKAVIGVIPDQPELWGPLRLKAHIKKMPFIIVCDGPYGYNLYAKGFKDLKSAISEVSYVLDKEKGWMAEEYRLPSISETKNIFKDHADEFELLDEVLLPDGSDIIIYRRRTVK